MGPTESRRPRSSRAIATALAASSLVAVVAAAVSGTGGVVLLRTATVAAFVTALAWAVYWRPEVEVSDGGIRVVNPFRTIHVPWPALGTVTDRWSLTLTTTDGRHVSAFAAPAGGAVERGRGVASDALALVTERREALRAAGFLDEVRVEGAPVTVRLSSGPVLAVGGALVLLLASFTLPL